MRRLAPLFAIALLTSLALGIAALAAPDRTVKVDGATPVAKWDGTAFPASNRSFELQDIAAEFDIPFPGQCGKTPLNYCEDTLVQVNAAGKMKVTLDGFGVDPIPDPLPPVTGPMFDDYDLYIYKSDAAGAIGDVAGASASGAGVPEVVELATEKANYVVRTVYYATILGGYKGTVELSGAAGPAPTGTPDPGGTATPAPSSTPGPGATPAPSSTPAPGATPAPPSTPAPQKPNSGLLPPSGPLTISFAVDKGKRKTARTRGIRTRLRCSVQCKVTAVATIDKKVAKKLKLGKKKLNIGTAKATIVRPGRIPFFIKLTKKAKKALGRKKVKKFKLTVAISVTDLSGNQLKKGNKVITLR